MVVENFMRRSVATPHANCLQATADDGQVSTRGFFFFFSRKVRESGVNIRQGEGLDYPPAEALEEVVAISLLWTALFSLRSCFAPFFSFFSVQHPRAS